MYYLSCTDSSTFPLILKTMFPFKLATLADRSWHLGGAPSPSLSCSFLHFPPNADNLGCFPHDPLHVGYPVWHVWHHGGAPLPPHRKPFSNRFFHFSPHTDNFSLILSVSLMSILTGMSETLVVPSSPLTGNPPSTDFWPAPLHLHTGNPGLHFWSFCGAVLVHDSPLTLVTLILFPYSQSMLESWVPPPLHAKSWSCSAPLGGSLSASIHNTASSLTSTSTCTHMEC